ncbi:MAG TPA: tRNA epoxyqueuosine(34) reductase QueG [Chthoniobacterales bacterium]
MTDELKRYARQLGFDDCRIATAARAPHADAFLAWLAAAHQGDMHWLERDPDRRTDPAQVLPGAKALVVVSMNYYQGRSARRTPGRFARYAWGADYHDLMLAKLKELAGFLAAQGGIQRCYVDTGPILERDFAAKAGVGWQGKSTLCLNETLGTWFFLGTIVTTLPLEPDAPARSRCGTCTRCLDACPTQALTAPYRLEATRCLSYLTIEHHGPIPVEFRRALGDRIYGCDECLEVCPWNRFAKQSRELRFRESDALQTLTLAQLAQLTPETFRRLFRHSPIKRLKWRRLIRNVCVCLGNVGTRSDLAVLEPLAQHSDGLIAEHARWAVEEITARCRPVTPEA